MIDYRNLDPDLPENPRYRAVRASVPCLAKAQRDFAALSLHASGDIWEAIADCLHDDVGAYLIAATNDDWMSARA